MSELDSRRLLNPDRLVCALVYDSLEAPKLRAAELPAPSSDTEGAAGEAVGAGARSSAGGDELSKGCGAEAGPDGEPAGGDRAEAGAAEGGRASGSPAGAAPAASGSTSVPMAASAALRLRARTAGRAARSAYRRLEAEEQGLDRSESMPNACNRQVGYGAAGWGVRPGRICMSSQTGLEDAGGNDGMRLSASSCAVALSSAFSHSLPWFHSTPLTHHLPCPIRPSWMLRLLCAQRRGAGLPTLKTCHPGTVQQMRCGLCPGGESQGTQQDG